MYHRGRGNKFFYRPHLNFKLVGGFLFCFLFCCTLNLSYWSQHQHKLPHQCSCRWFTVDHSAIDLHIEQQVSAQSRARTADFDCQLALDIQPLFLKRYGYNERLKKIYKNNWIRVPDTLFRQTKHDWSSKSNNSCFFFFLFFFFNVSTPRPSHPTSSPGWTLNATRG